MTVWTYSWRVLWTGVRFLCGKPLAWISGVFGVLGVPGLLVLSGWGIISPYLILVLASVIVCAALVSGAYQLYQDGQRSLLAGLNERRRLRDRLEAIEAAPSPAQPISSSVHPSVQMTGVSFTGNDIGIQINDHRHPS